MPSEYGATLTNIVDETWFVTNETSADAAGGGLRKEIFAGVPVSALTVAQIGRLALPEFLIENKCVAKV